MPETDVLNPTAIWEEDIQDSMCPSYGFTRKRTGTQLRKKAIGGSPWSRETQNTGHSFNFSWLGRSYACVQRLKWYSEQYEDGFFSIVDWDGGERYYTGRFTSEVTPVETGNGLYDVQNVTFEEIPKCPMVQYPDDWDHDAVTFYANNDFGDQKLATSGTWTLTSRQIDGNSVKTMDGAGAAGDWAQYEYRGYGFKLFLLQGPEFGECQVQLDGIAITPEGASSTTIDCYAAEELGAQMLCMQSHVVLDLHRVKVIAFGAKNAASSGTAISFHSLQVMR
jgi:hypothetical protein